MLGDSDVFNSNEFVHDSDELVVSYKFEFVLVRITPVGAPLDRNIGSSSPL